MQDNLDYKTYIFLSSKNIIISVYTELDKKVLEEEFLIENSKNTIDFQKLNYFLDENIFIIEKKLKNFINKVTVILDSESFFFIEVSVKNNYENVFNLKNINRLLFDAKNYCKKTLNNNKIVHIIINNYRVDNQDHSYLPKSTQCKSFSLDVSFLCIPEHLTLSLEEILKKYQISLNKIVSANYVKKFLSDDEKDIFLMSDKIIKGFNSNEAILVNKTNENEGFFEKFFNLFN